MPLADHDRVLHVLDDAECHRLLGTTPLGRLAFSEGALPTIQPVSYAVSGGQIVIPTRVGSAVAVGARGAVVAFEVDEYDAAERTGWNVTVVGPSRVVADPAGMAELDGLGARAWAPPDDSCYIAVRISVIRGRRLAPALAGAPRATGTATGR